MMQLIEKVDLLLLAYMRCENAGHHDMAMMWAAKAKELLQKCAAMC